MNKAPRYWFCAKRYGWGWGLPVVWQGWVALILWVVILLAGEMVTHRYGTGIFVAFIVGMAAILIAICLAKGEPPRWRWGGK